MYFLRWGGAERGHGEHISTLVWNIFVWRDGARDGLGQCGAGQEQWRGAGSGKYFNSILEYVSGWSCAGSGWVGQVGSGRSETGRDWKRPPNQFEVPSGALKHIGNFLLYFAGRGGRCSAARGRVRSVWDWTTMFQIIVISLPAGRGPTNIWKNFLRIWRFRAFSILGWSSGIVDGEILNRNVVGFRIKVWFRRISASTKDFRFCSKVCKNTPS